MAAVRSLQVSVKSDSGSDHSDSDSDSESDRDAREAEPMEVEEGELDAEDVSVNRSLKELLPDTSRRYENKAGAFITGIDVNSKEAIERKEKRARRFHFCAEESVAQRNVFLDKDMMKKAIPSLRMEAIYVTGVDEMSTQDVFGYFKEYPPAHIEWIDDTSCNVVWLDDNTCIRALFNSSRMPDPEAVTTETQTDDQSGKESKDRRGQRSDNEDDDEEEEGEVDEDEETGKKNSEGKDSEGEAAQDRKVEPEQVDDLSVAERESLLRNDLRPVIRPFKGNKLFLRIATHDDKKELGAARRSRYYMKYGNPNYGGMKGILSNSWKRRFHNRRIQRDVIKTKKPLIGDSMGHTPPYTHRHSADLVNLPEEPIKEEEEEEEEDEDEHEQGEDKDEDMEEDDRVVEYKERAERDRGERGGGGSKPLEAGLRSRAARSPSPWSESDEMDYDLELKMISTPSPKKSKKMTMYADELDTHLKSIRNRIGGSGSQSRPKSASPPKVTDVRQLLEEKRQGLSQHRQPPPVAPSGKTDVRQRLGKRRYSPDRRRSPSPVSPRDTPPSREPIRDVHRRLGAVSTESRGHFSTSSKDRKTGGLWSRLGSADNDTSSRHQEQRTTSRSTGLFSSSSSSSSSGRKNASDATASSSSRRGQGEGEEGEGEEVEEEDDSTLQKMWGAMIKQKQERQTHQLKKSRLDNLPSLQIEISRDSSEDSDA
ncbi:nuclear cap-binding protein subunit 3 isoform X2 [Notolabrus celidotus]|uniref:nuclear cap-binding protein subunit 3 isoform X2 n=1 Tax=Notolabrus celidotus TaxID=1203425 RepID=UPI0014904DEF|nr:nuclear cap-binding protein subunit 3 isoform X2 [Notolabrus celidotus]